MSTIRWIVTPGCSGSMSKIRLFVDVALRQGTEIEIDGSRAHYAGSVLRLRPGNPVTLFNGRGGEYTAHVQSVRKAAIRVVVDRHLVRNPESVLRIHLFQGLSKGDRMDIVVQKATELGVASITPLVTDFTVVKLDERRVAKRLQRWRSIAVNACEQCGRNLVPEVSTPVEFNAWLGDADAASGNTLVLDPASDVSIRTAALGEEKSVALVVGPEGGFSDAELLRVKEAGLTLARLGPRVLRTETAALAAVSLVQGLYGDL